MGIGMALMEETVLDPQTGRLLVKNLADYHVPVHADIPSIDVLTFPVKSFEQVANPHKGRAILTSSLRYSAAF